MLKLDHRSRYNSLLIYYAPFNVPAKWLWAQVYAESDFTPTAKSPAGALGLSQFMPPHLGRVGKWRRRDQPRARHSDTSRLHELACFAM